MGKRHFVFVIFAFFVLTVQLLPQNTQPTTFYVSSGSGGQILAINPNATPAATVTVVYPTSPQANFVPEDMIVGPDGNLWVCSTTSNQILRLLVVPSTPTATILSSQTVFDNSGNDPAKPTRPEGCSFASTVVANGSTIVPSSLDLYFNAKAATSSCSGTSCSGVWKIAGAAIVPTSGTFSIPPTAVSQPFTSKAEAAEFDKFGNLLAVDQANTRVMRGLHPNPSTGLYSFNCGPSIPNCVVSPFIPALSDVAAAQLAQPTGVAVNTCHDILVTDSSAATLKRYSGDTGKFLDQMSFGSKDNPRHVECDITNNCYAVTGDETGSQSSDGKIWLIKPPTTDQQLTSCALPANPSAPSSTGNTVTLLADLKHLASGQFTGSIPLSGINNALGVAVPATSMTISHTFNTPAASNDYNFGHHRLSAQCAAVILPFRLDITSVLSRPPEVPSPEISFSTSFSCPSPTSTTGGVPVSSLTCDHYASQHGFCNQYIERAFDSGTGVAISDSAMTGYCVSGGQQAFTFWIFNQSDDLLNFPGMAHYSNGNSLPDISTEAGRAYDECVTHDFYAIAADGTFCRTCNNSKRIQINSSLTACSGTAKLTLNSPISSCTTKNGVISCNPQFNIGQNIAVKATATCNGATNNSAVERLSIIRVEHTTGPTTTQEAVPQNVVATKNAAVDNFMNVNSQGVYSYNANSSQFDILPKGSTALYQVTIWGNGAVPLSFLITGAF